jgi:hypothetical protein
MNPILLDIFGIPLFDGDRISLLLVRLSLDLLVAGLVVFGVYRSKSEDGNGYIFTFVVFNLIIFFICYLLSAVELSLGFAFGLFALFSILRYRTVTVNIREMAFLFVVISVGIINALPYKSLTWVELLLIDGCLLGGTALLHQLLYRHPSSSLLLKYERMDLLEPQKKSELMADLKSRTGLDVTSVRVESMNFITDSAELRVFFKTQTVSALPQQP